MTRTIEQVNQEYTNTLTFAGEKLYKARLLELEAQSLYKVADALNIEAGEFKKKVTAISETTESITSTEEAKQVIDAALEESMKNVNFNRAPDTTQEIADAVELVD